MAIAPTINVKKLADLMLKMLNDRSCINFTPSAAIERRHYLDVECVSAGYQNKYTGCFVYDRIITKYVVYVLACGMTAVAVSYKNVYSVTNGYKNVAEFSFIDVLTRLRS